MMDKGLCNSLQHRAVIQLFQAAHGVKISPAGIADIQSASAEDIVQISAAQGIAPMIADGLEQLEEIQLGIDRDLYIFFQEIREGNRVRNQKMKAQLTSAVAVLGNDDIPTVVLKGGCEFALPSYRQVHRRFIGDLDLLVPKTALRRAVSSLESQGYIETYQDDEFYRSPEHHEAPLVNESWPAAVEIHGTIGGKRGEQLLPADHIMKTAVETSIANLMVPTRLNRLVHLVFHQQVQNLGFQNRLISLRTLADLVALAADENHLHEARRPFEAFGLQSHFDGLLAMTDFILPDVLPSFNRNKDAEKWALAAITRMGTPRLVSVEMQVRKVMGWTWSYATDPRLRSIYRSKLSKSGRFKRMLGTLRNNRQH